MAERIRLVALGGPKTGKSSIIKRFLFNTFSDKTKTTVEDLYSRDYDFGQITLKVDILDTAGDLSFPAMRRLSIATAHAFLLVYAIDDVQSFEYVKSCFLEIQEQRLDFEDIPIVIAGNKMDVELTNVKVEFDDVSGWMSDSLPVLNYEMLMKVLVWRLLKKIKPSLSKEKVDNLFYVIRFCARFCEYLDRAKIMECSAKTGGNVKEVFRSFLHLAKIPMRQESEEGDCGSGLRRRLSAHAGSKSKNRSPSTSTTPTQPSSPVLRAPPSPSAGSKQSPQFLTPDNPFPFDRNKPRSRSLIRRCSKKVKKQVQDASEGGPDGCLIC